MIGIEQDRDGKEKRRSERQRSRKAMVRNGMAPNRYDRTRNGIEERRQDLQWKREALISGETEKQKYRAGGIRQKGKLNEI